MNKSNVSFCNKTFTENITNQDVKKGNSDIDIEVKQLLAFLLSFDYGMLCVNKPKLLSANDTSEEYRTIPIKKFLQYKIGVCYDFVNYEAKWFKEHKYTFRTYYFAFEGNTQKTHTALFFEYHGSVYWFEASWRKYSAIRKFSSYDDAIQFVGRLFYANYRRYLCDLYAFQYDTTGMDQNLTSQEFTNRASNGKETKIKTT